MFILGEYAMQNYRTNMLRDLIEYLDWHLYSVHSRGNSKCKTYMPHQNICYTTIPWHVKGSNVRQMGFKHV